MRTVDDVFEAFGGPAAVGKAIGKSTEHAAAMRRRGSIPVDYWLDLIAAADKAGIEGVNTEALTRMHARERVA